MNLFVWTENLDYISSYISVDNDGTLKEALISKSRLVKSIPQQQMFVIFVVINLTFPPAQGDVGCPFMWVAFID